MSDMITVDISQLAVYLDKACQISSVSKVMAGVALQDMIKGQDIAGAMLARAIREDARMKAKLDQAKSIAYLDRSSDYLREKGMKDTNESRKMYVDIDEDVMTAVDNKAQTEALVILLKNKLSILRQSHDDIKKILYGDQHTTSWEGM